MKFSTASIFLAALGVSAHPSGHAHKRAHNSVEARGDFVIANKPADPSSAAPVAAPTPSPVSPPAAPPAGSSAPASPASPAGQGVGPSVYTDFCVGNAKRATQAEIAYKGDVGSNGHYGCNLMTVKSNLLEQYQYTVVFNNAGPASTIFCWLKIGPDGGINGFFKGNEALSFDLPAGGQQVLAVDSNTQFGCAAGPLGAGPELTNIGQFGSTWLEGDVGNLSNKGWSGFDVSSIVSAAAGLTIPGLKVCGTEQYADQCSTIWPGGKGDNAFVGGTEALNGLGLNIAAGKTSVIVTVNFSG
ncbi:hypothetical protein V8C35DRAFT_292360 [Trichoderma chlorosporum]